MSIPVLPLNDGVTIPQVGLGVWQVKDEDQFTAAFEQAVLSGYRHFDTAQIYENEQMIGNAIANSSIPREEFFITTKIWVNNFTKGRARRSFEESVKKLQTEYVDLLLLHFPVTGLRKNAWSVLEELQAEGKARAIGVSNYTIKHLEGMKKYAKVMPAVNQVELHVFLQQPELLEYCRNEGIVVEAYSPLAHARKQDDPVLAQIAEKHGKSYAQVMLRWCIEQGLVVLPKSVTPSRIEENSQLFDFALGADDLHQLKALDQDLRTCWNPTRVP